MKFIQISFLKKFLFVRKTYIHVAYFFIVYMYINFKKLQKVAKSNFLEKKNF